jgi:hypothetical protein
MSLRKVNALKHHDHPLRQPKCYQSSEVEELSLLNSELWHVSLEHEKAAEGIEHEHEAYEFENHLHPGCRDYFFYVVGVCFLLEGD